LDHAPTLGSIFSWPMGAGEDPRLCPHLMGPRLAVLEVS
jgi:hypothetical protein